MAPGVTLQVGAALPPEEVNAAYAWVEWPQREAWRLEAIGRSCTWIAARDGNGALVGIARILDDGGLHASLWDVIVRPDMQRQGIGRAMVEAALGHCRDRSLLVLVSTPAAAGFFEQLGFVPESHGHVAMYLRPHRSAPSLG
ncbi:MAG TPA: GNAT family N-acetyltransferase [candidate division Zixibacteria bacterium]|nr:GNAT family N-acetyltransferase [candidate division Zixibacteria bacterium]